MPKFCLQPEYMRQATFMKNMNAKGSFTLIKRHLTDIEMLDMILDQHPEYLMVRFGRNLYANEHGVPDLNWIHYFGYNYMMIREDRKDINRELHEYLYHPSRIDKWINEGNDIEDYLV